jgi:hypothetical protein
MEHSPEFLFSETNTKHNVEKRNQICDVTQSVSGLVSSEKKSSKLRNGME